MRCFVWICGSLVLLLASLPSTAWAYEEQATLGLEVGYAGLPTSDTLPRSGVDVGLSAGGGFGDAWSIQGLLSYNIFPNARALHLGMVGIEQNAIVKILSVAAVIFLPPTLIASIYGMNFDHMPELHWGWGYAGAWLLMLTVGGTMLAFFKRKGWL